MWGNLTWKFVVQYKSKGHMKGEQGMHIPSFIFASVQYILAILRKNGFTHADSIGKEV